MPEVQSVTNLHSSPEDERRSRMRGYLIAMSVRVVCIILGVFVKGPLMWVCFAGAIFLPYFAVVFANAVGGSAKTKATSVQKSTAAITAEPIKVKAEDFKIVSKPND